MLIAVPYPARRLYCVGVVNARASWREKNDRNLLLSKVRWLMDGCEAPGVEPSFPGLTKEQAISYARGRFGGSPNGEIHVYKENGDTLVEVIKPKGGITFGN